MGKRKIGAEVQSPWETEKDKGPGKARGSHGDQQAECDQCVFQTGVGE